MDEAKEVVKPFVAPTHGAPWLLWAGVALTALTVIAVLILTWAIKGQDPPLPVISQLPDFALTDQQGRPVTLASLRGQVWIADIIFTRCAGPCPQMTKRMSQLQEVLPAQAPVKLVTLTTDPGFDTPAVMKRFGERFGADFNRWLFLTGAKPQIQRLAVEGLKLVALDKPAAEQTTPQDLFIHSTIFVIVDQQGRLRDAFDSTEPGFQKRVSREVRQLLRAP